MNCCNEVIKTSYSTGYTQQLIDRKIIFALLWLKVAQNYKIFSDKQYILMNFENASPRLNPLFHKTLRMSRG